MLTLCICLLSRKLLANFNAIITISAFHMEYNACPAVVQIQLLQFHVLRFQSTHIALRTDEAPAMTMGVKPLEDCGGGRRSSAEDERIEAPKAARGVGSVEGLCPFPENL